MRRRRGEDYEGKTVGNSKTEERERGRLKLKWNDVMTEYLREERW